MTEPTLIWLYRTFRNIVNIKCIRCIEVSYLGNVGKIILREEKSDFRDGCLYLGNVNEMIFQEMEKSNFRNVKKLKMKNKVVVFYKLISLFIYISRRKKHISVIALKTKIFIVFIILV